MKMHELILELKLDIFCFSNFYIGRTIYLFFSEIMITWKYLSCILNFHVRISTRFNEHKHIQCFKKHFGRKLK